MNQKPSTEATGADPSALAGNGPSTAELLRGYELGPKETVRIDITPSPEAWPSLYPLGKDEKGEDQSVSGSPQASIQIGGESTYATAVVINTHDGGPEARSDLLLIYPPDGSTPILRELERGVMWNIGRNGEEDMDALPDTVSRDHCDIGLSEEGQLVVENHSPTNKTIVKKPKDFKPELKITAHREVYEPTAEQLSKGYVLESRETVLVEAPPSAGAARKSYEIGDGLTIDEAQTVAHVAVGGTKSSATALILHSLKGGKEGSYFLLLDIPGSERTFVRPLQPGRLWDIGRDQEEQHTLPDTVSRDHCAIGIDEETGKIVVENHNPSNYTVAYR